MKIRLSDLRDIIKESIDSVLAEKVQPREEKVDEEWNENDYKHYAHKLIMNWGAPHDFDWSRAVTNYVRHTKATAGIDLDAEKLFKAVQDEIDQAEEDAVNPTFTARSAYDK